MIIIANGKVTKPKTVENTPEGHVQLSKVLNKHEEPSGFSIPKGLHQQPRVARQRYPGN